ncbi:alpha/beta fold hydrolase [Paractinoplanes lichenicola]|uniref:Alpha/beta hydrolase n=1 Tax=Paractinoplanes lichenicola TaxID=2802976 RepID=A0ABS1VMB8_9ACTN|nr:alpha/beta hydrolase [Actinoplanes lichenicola]MBL7255877.1 alpha/beta hydrolase [Actinoplanes lichenicola]
MESRMIRVRDVELHVGVTGSGPDVVVLSGGPGCVHYLERDDLAPRGHRAWFPEPRGVGRSGGGPHTMAEAIADLESIRAAVGVGSWIVVGHSWGSDLGVRYAVERPEAVTALVGVAGRGPQRDRTWTDAYEKGKGTEPAVEIAWDPGVHAALGESFTDWIHRPELWRSLAGCEVPMHFIAAADDIRPSWPLAQLAALVPHGRFSTVPGVPHDFWFTHPGVWTETITTACAG